MRGDNRRIAAALAPTIRGGVPVYGPPVTSNGSLPAGNAGAWVSGPQRPRNDASRAAARPAVLGRSLREASACGALAAAARWPPVAHWLPAAPGF